MLLVIPVANTSGSDTYGDWTYTSATEIPTGTSLTFCADNSSLVDTFQTFADIAAKAKAIAIASLVILAILAAAAMAWWEIKRYQKAVHKCQRLAEGRGPMEISYLLSRPLTASTGLWVAEKLPTGRDPGRQRRRQTLIRWVLAYATTHTTLLVLSLALAGGVSCLCQFLLVRAVQKEAAAATLATEASLGIYVGDVRAELARASTQWANASNAEIVALQEDINEDVLSYVLKATSAVNATLFKLNQEVNTTLVGVFGDTPLEKFFDNIYDCILGDKLAEMDKGINWVHDHAQVSFPLFPTDVFALGDDNNSAISRLLTNSTTTTIADEITAAVNKVVNTLWSNIVQEGLISLVLLFVYLTYVSFGVAQAALRICFRDEYGTLAGDRTFGRLGM